MRRIRTVIAKPIIGSAMGAPSATAAQLANLAQLRLQLGQDLGRPRLGVGVRPARGFAREEADALLVALDPGQSALLRPAAVAIHNDGDVPRHHFERRIHPAKPSASGLGLGPR